MARIPYVNNDNANQEVSEIFTKMETNGAVVLNLWKMAAHSPVTLIHMIRMGNSILSKTELAPKLREIAILRVAGMIDCAYEKKAHTMLGKSVGITDEQITLIDKDWENSGVFNVAELAVLRYTDEIIKHNKVSKITFSELEKHFNHREMMELTIAIGYYRMLAMLLLTFEVDLESNNLTSPSHIVGHSST